MNKNVLLNKLKNKNNLLLSLKKKRGFRKNINIISKTNPKVIGSPSQVSNNNTKLFKNKPVSQYNIQIPTNIFQTWENRNKIPPIMFRAMQKIKRFNPRFKYYLFDDNDCREFIKKHFDVAVLHAYDSLIPGAYKADLWRYCVLYKIGGIYLDIKFIPINGFRFINLLEKEHFVNECGGFGIYNALLVCKPGNEILLKAINQIVENVKNKFYGSSCLDPTGPNLLGSLFTEEEKKSFDCVNGPPDSYKTYILYKNFPILKCYNGYLKERQLFSSTPHYGELWNNRQIYR